MTPSAAIEFQKRKAMKAVVTVDKAFLEWYYNQASTGKRCAAMVFEN